MAFSLNRGLKGTDNEVRSYRRQVTLTGQVGSPVPRRLAVEAARRTSDVAGVTATPASRPSARGARAASGEYFLHFEL
jgi:hypothetical protein